MTIASSFPCTALRAGVLVFSITVLPHLSAAGLIFQGNSTHANLIELYSSEGCSSCPPAEAWVSKLKTSPRLFVDSFPVAFHVDYWDGLGWPDRFARPEFTQRQRDYAARLRQNSVYTPEFVVNGREWRGWFTGDRAALSQGATRGELKVTGTPSGTSFSTTYTEEPGADKGDLLINVALLGTNLTTDVQAGENGGHRLQHDFVVLAFQSKPLAAGENPNQFRADVSVPTTKDTPRAVVAWVSSRDGSIVQIAGGWLHDSLADR